MINIKPSTGSRLDTIRRLEVFASSLEIVVSGCWEWIKGKDNAGYAAFYSAPEKRSVRGHRYLYELIHGDIKDMLPLDHLCRNRACVNPNHLEVVTARINQLRGFGKSGINARATACHRGHPFTPENTYIRKDGKGRECRHCQKLWHRASKPLAKENQP